jgi:c-di-GMP-binding flagellar brake protein YcgR
MPPNFGIVPQSPSVINSGLQQEMDRRSKTRVDMQLTCLVAADRLEATPVRVFTENVSRTGILMRWAANSPLPEVSKTMTLDVQLPENSEFGPRVMRCRATVVRITRRSGDQPAVAFEVQNMRFIKPRSRKARDLASMPLATNRVI